MSDGDGDWWPAESGGRSNECAFGADVATCGDVFGPSWPTDGGLSPSVTERPVVPPRGDAPGVGNESGPGFASRNALWQPSRQSFRSARVGGLERGRGLHRTACIAFARRQVPASGGLQGLALERLRGRSAVAKSANGWYFATSLGVVGGAGQVVEAAESSVDRRSP